MNFLNFDFDKDGKYLVWGLLIAIVLQSVWVGRLLSRVDALERDVKNIVESIKYLSDNMAVRAK